MLSTCASKKAEICGKRGHNFSCFLICGCSLSQLVVGWKMLFPAFTQQQISCSWSGLRIWQRKFISSTPFLQKLHFFCLNLFPNCRFKYRALEMGDKYGTGRRSFAWLLCTNQGWTGKVFFTGRGQAPGQGTYCVYQLIEITCYSRGNLDLHFVKWS